MFPASYDRYIEVFGGGGWVLFGKPPDDRCMEIYNDYNSNLANLFYCVKNRTGAFLKELGFLPLNSRDEFTVIRNFIEKQEPDTRFLIEELELAEKHLMPPDYEEVKKILLENAEVLDLTRDIMESYLIYLQTEAKERKNYRSDLYGLRRVIEDVGNHYDRQDIKNLFISTDFPSTPRYLFKFYSDETIKKLNENIFQMDEQIARALILHQLLGTRISDTLTLKTDCLSIRENRYFIRIEQVKSITFEKAISDEIAQLIIKSIDYTEEHYGKTKYIFVKKEDPLRPFQYSMLQHRVMQMIRKNDIRDENGELLNFGTHTFRHCYGKKLTEMHIDDWMIARLLGHKTLQSVHHYRKIGNKIMADETRAVREKIDMILMDVVKEWDGYEI